MGKVGRPKKEKNQKVEYQLIAVHANDYETFIAKADKAGIKKVTAFHQMVTEY